MEGLEVDVNVYNATDVGCGLCIIGWWHAQPTNFPAIKVQQPLTGAYAWTTGLVFEGGSVSSGQAIVINPTSTASTSVSSMAISFTALSSAGAIETFNINEDASGNLVFSSGASIDVDISQSGSITAPGNLTAGGSITATGNIITSSQLLVTNSTTTDGEVLASFYQASLPTGDFNDVLFGVNSTAGNAGQLQFNYVASGSTSNSVGIGFNGVGNDLIIYNSGAVAIPALSSSSLPLCTSTGGTLTRTSCSGAVASSSITATGYATCVKTIGPPPTLGYCSTVVSATGTCTCN
jgi:hypothetical protein